MAGSRTVEGKVVEALPHDMFAVELDDGRKVIGHVSEGLRMRSVRVLPGERVKVELSPYDPTRGRISERYK